MFIGLFRRHLYDVYRYKATKLCKLYSKLLFPANVWSFIGNSIILFVDNFNRFAVKLNVNIYVTVNRVKKITLL